MRYWEAMYQRADPPEDAEAEPALLREARLAVIASDWGATPAAPTTAHLLRAVTDDQVVESACSVAAADSPLPSCAPWSEETSHARRSPQTVRSHQLVVKTPEEKAAKNGRKNIAPCVDRCCDTRTGSAR